MPMNDILLQARDVKKTFLEGREPVEVLRGVSLELRRGEVVALEGPSGSGKSTLLCILGCILTPTSGSLFIDGTTISDKTNLAAVRKKSIGFVFQQFNLFPALTALENVEYALNVKGTLGKAAREQAKGALDAVELGHRANFLPRDLSGGQKQRVAIARALVGGSPVLLADEPTANLDTQVGTQVLQLFRRLATERQRALLIVTHDPKVRAVSDRVLHIQDGALY